ncbi:MAG: hypothetical protein K6E11_01945 [Bacilli bacterium]|nr:hypothetical protein [Bacilli bacterium]
MAKQSSSKYRKLERSYASKSKKLYSSNDGKELLDIISSGRNKYLRLDRFESSAMDMTWIKQIEDCIDPLGDIVNNPKKTIQTLTEVVQVEKVKKIGIETVQHLSSHTQFIKTIDENGDVTPSKLLNVYNDDFYAIYENRFIATLIRHLLIFVEKRYQFVLQNATLSDVGVLYMKNHTEHDGAVIDIETKVRYSRPAEAVAIDKLKGYLKRIEDIRKYLKFYANTEFMKILRRERDVRNPILQTNIIRKNPKYHKCYLLWLFINRFKEAGIEVKVEENYSELSEEQIREINETMCSSFLLLRGKDMSPRTEKSKKAYKPVFMKTYDDEIYKPMDYKGPIEYIRVDDKYREYSESLHVVEPHPTKQRKAYDKEKYDDNKARRVKKAEVDALLKRKEKEKAIYEENEKLALEREIARDKYVEEKAEQEIREEAIAKVEKAREKLVGKANKAKPAPKKKVVEKKQPKKAPAKKAEPKKKPVKKAEPKKQPVEKAEPKKEKPAKKVEKKVEKKPVKKVEKKVELKPAKKPVVQKKESKPKEAPKKAPVKKETPKKVAKPKPAPKKEEPKKVEEPKPKVEKPVEAKPVEPVKVVEPPKEEKPVEQPKPVEAPKVEPKPAPKKAPKPKAKKEKPETFAKLSSFRSKIK